MYFSTNDIYYCGIIQIFKFPKTKILIFCHLYTFIPLLSPATVLQITVTILFYKKALYLIYYKYEKSQRKHSHYLKQSSPTLPFISFVC